jgi:hypothetical protein
VRRAVYTKVLKGETMVRKFVLWKTNKEFAGGDFPAYVLHFTDFSPSRKVPLAREVRVSSSLDQMFNLWSGLVDENIKKGWDLHSLSTEPLPLSATIIPTLPAAPVVSSEPVPPPTQSTTPSAPTKRKTRTAKTTSVAADEVPVDGTSVEKQTGGKRKQGKKSQ